MEVKEQIAKLLSDTVGEMEMKVGMKHGVKGIGLSATSLIKALKPSSGVRKLQNQRMNGPRID